MTAKLYTIRANKAALAERNALLEQARVIGDMLSQPLLGADALIAELDK